MTNIVRHSSISFYFRKNARRMRKIIPNLTQPRNNPDSAPRKRIIARRRSCRSNAENVNVKVATGSWSQLRETSLVRFSIWLSIDSSSPEQQLTSHTTYTVPQNDVNGSKDSFITKLWNSYLDGDSRQKLRKHENIKSNWGV